MRTAMLVTAVLSVTAFGAFGLSNQQLEKRWNEIMALQIRNEAVRQGVDMSRVTLTVDVKKQVVDLSGQVGTPWEAKTLARVAKTSGLVNTLNDDIEIVKMPEQWRHLRAYLRDSAASDTERNTCSNLLTRYDDEIRQYNELMARREGRQESQTRNDLRRLVKELSDLEVQIEECNLFWVDETVRQLQEYRAAKDAVLTNAPAAEMPAPTAPAAAASAVQ